MLLSRFGAPPFTCASILPARRAKKAAAPNSQALGSVPADQLQLWDVVEYAPAPAPHKDQAVLRLGLVQQVDADAVQVAPLVEEDEGIWVPEEDAQEQQVPMDAVLRIIEHAYGQRQDCEHNPHGEHAHDVWQVLSPLSTAVFRGDSTQR